MKQLKNTKKADGRNSPEKTTTVGGITKYEESPINQLLFSGMKKGATSGLSQLSFANTINSNDSTH